jgi:circadian clock protein KaiB
MAVGTADEPAVSPENGWVFGLYVAGRSPRSRRALDNLTKLCEDQLSGRYEIEVIDLTVEASRARSDNIVAVPTLIRRTPAPVLRLIGDLADTECLLRELQLEQRHR